MRGRKGQAGAAAVVATLLLWPHANTGLRRGGEALLADLDCAAWLFADHLFGGAGGVVDSGLASGSSKMPAYLPAATSRSSALTWPD